MNERLGAVCAELATLWPALAAALRRDTSPGTAGAQMVSSLVNADVMHAMLTLKQEIPLTAAFYVNIIGEPWAPRDLPGWLVAIPRIGERLEHLNRAAEAAELSGSAAGWLRLTKAALGLRHPDIPIGCPCPYADSHDGGQDVVLLAQGSEGYLRRTTEGLTVEWEDASRIYCPACGASWVGPGEWQWLGKLLGPANMSA